MKKQIRKVINPAKRAIASVLAILMVAVSASGIAFAAANGGQVQMREIRMSDNSPSGQGITYGVGSGTNVTYRVAFQAASDYNIKGVVLDFCAGVGGTPFIGDPTCAKPPGFNLNTPTVDTSNYTYGSPSKTLTGLGTTGDWTVTTANSGQTFKMNNTSSTPVAVDHDEDPNNAPGPVTYSFAISGITNPAIDTTGGNTKPGTFYARLITYTDTSSGGSFDSYTHSNPGTYQDYGGFALSTAYNVQVTAKVQETLSFCVSGTTDTRAYPTGTLVAPNTCSDTQVPAIILGHGDNNTLDASAVDRNSVWTITSTNALNGVTIRMHNSNFCGGLSTEEPYTSGGVANASQNCAIPAVGPNTPGAITAGTANFGMLCHNSDPGPIGTLSDIPVTGTGTCDPNYYDSANPTFYGMDTTSLDDNVKTTFGDTIVTSTGPISNVRNKYDFAATASNTTPAGIYKANMAMIATGRF